MRSHAKSMNLISNVLRLIELILNTFFFGLQLNFKKGLKKNGSVYRSKARFSKDFMRNYFLLRPSKIVNMEALLAIFHSFFCFKINIFDLHIFLQSF